MSIPDHLLDPPDIPEVEVDCPGFTRSTPCVCGGTELEGDPPECAYCYHPVPKEEWTPCNAHAIMGSGDHCASCGYPAPEPDHVDKYTFYDPEGD